jgi:Raf kinase inhibitor-like YbhB/YbcL family protein
MRRIRAYTLDMTAGQLSRDPLRLMLAAACIAGASLAAAGADMSVLKLGSNAFKDGASLDTRFTCDSDNLSPPLAWTGAPLGTKSFALIVDDPDAPDPAAPQMTWVHWVLYDIPAGVHALPEGGSGSLPAGTREGVNDWKRTGYGGPCPPIGRHRYFHKLYALDAVLPDLHNPGKTQLEAAMRGHVLAEAHLMGTYQKK